MDNLNIKLSYAGKKMINFNNKKTKKIFSNIIIIVIVLSMILTVVLPLLT